MIQKLEKLINSQLKYAKIIVECKDAIEGYKQIMQLHSEVEIRNYALENKGKLLAEENNAAEESLKKVKDKVKEIKSSADHKAKELIDKAEATADDLLADAVIEEAHIKDECKKLNKKYSDLNKKITLAENKLAELEKIKEKHQKQLKGFLED